MGDGGGGDGGGDEGGGAEGGGCDGSGGDGGRGGGGGRDGGRGDKRYSVGQHGYEGAGGWLDLLLLYSTGGNVVVGGTMGGDMSGSWNDGGGVSSYSSRLNSIA
jgi:hypothetical protein